MRGLFPAPVPSVERLFRHALYGSIGSDQEGTIAQMGSDMTRGNCSVPSKAGLVPPVKSEPRRVRARSPYRTGTADCSAAL